MMQPDQTAANDPAPVLRYAGVVDEKPIYNMLKANTVSYALTGVALLVALSFVHITYSNACAGFYRSNGEIILATWIVSGLALIDSGVGFSMALGRSRRASRVRPLAICTLANLICLLTPTLWDLRATYWPH